MNRHDFANTLRHQPLLLDGAMGTMIHSHGIGVDSSFDAINQIRPALIAEIHRAYIAAGADILETNSFGANRFKLAEFGLQDQVEAINEAAVTIARRAIDSSFKKVLLAGSIGPLGVRLAPLGRVSLVAAQEAFMEQITALVHPKLRGVDLLMLETMSDPAELQTAVTAARHISPEMPVVAQMTFTRDDRTILGQTPVQIGQFLNKLDVDVIGVNCSGGPAQVLRILRTMQLVAPEKIFAVSPNAGWPEQTERGRVFYPATPAYFGRYAQAFIQAGAVIVGGCCGTTEKHIAAMRDAMDRDDAEPFPLPEISLVEHEGTPTGQTGQPTQLARNLAGGNFVVTVEISPPRGIGTERLLMSARMLKEAGANLLNIADSPLARMRMSAWAAAHLVQKNVGLETVLHFPTRGRNLLRVQGDLLAAYSLGIRNLFVTMGDPTRIGDYPEAMDSYDIVPTGLLQLIKTRFNNGVDMSGRAIDHPTLFTVGCALNCTPHHPERELKLLRKKVINGADFALTQPIFDPPAAQKFIALYQERYGEAMIPLLAGIKTLYNTRNADFLHHEVPGIEIPAAHRRRIKQAADPQKEGVRIAQELIEEIRPFAQGIYIMPAFGRFDLIAEILDNLPRHI